MKTGNTEANRILAQLLALTDGDLRAVLTAAVAYGEHPSIRGQQNYAAGTRLADQIRMALEAAGPPATEVAVLVIGRDYEFGYQIPGGKRRRARATLIDSGDAAALARAYGTDHPGPGGTGWLIFAIGEHESYAVNHRWITTISQVDTDPAARYITDLPAATAPGSTTEGER